MKSIEKEFIDFYIKVGKTWGLDNLSSKLLGTLYLEPSEISIEDLAKKTGYSLASISNKMRFLENFGMLQKIKKPGSKKVFYYMEKNCIKTTQMHFEKIFNDEIMPAKELMPKLLDKFNKNNMNKKEMEKYEIIKNYNKQMLVIEKIFQKTMRYLKEVK